MDLTEERAVFTIRAEENERRVFVGNLVPGNAWFTVDDLWHAWRIMGNNNYDPTVKDRFKKVCKDHLIPFDYRVIDGIEYYSIDHERFISQRRVRHGS